MENVQSVQKDTGKRHAFNQARLKAVLAMIAAESPLKWHNCWLPDKKSNNVF